VEVVTGLDFSTIHESIHNKNYWEIAKEETNGIWLSLLGKTERSNIGLFSSFALEGDFMDTGACLFIMIRKYAPGLHRAYKEYACFFQQIGNQLYRQKSKRRYRAPYGMKEKNHWKSF
jgi:hypothetical protein